MVRPGRRAPVQVTSGMGNAVPGSAMQSARSEKVVSLLAPAGLSQIFVIHEGVVPGVVPTGPQSAAVVKIVWLFTPAGFVQVDS